MSDPVRRFEARISERLTELIAEGRRLLDGPETPTGHIADAAALLGWGASCENLLERALEKDSSFMRRFTEVEAKAQQHLTPNALKAAVAVLDALNADIRRGLLFDRELLAAADVFDDFLEQAAHLVENGYKDAAAMLTGAVLEAALRKLCEKHNVAFGLRDTIEPLNRGLAKARAYDKLIQKQITAWADVRNNADHGHFDKYSMKDVNQMHHWVRHFVEQRLSEVAQRELEVDQNDSQR